MKQILCLEYNILYCVNLLFFFLTAQTKEMNIDILQNILTGIFKTWQDTLSKEEKVILCNKFLPSSDSRKAFKESKLLLLEYLWLNYAKSNGLQSANFRE